MNLKHFTDRLFGGISVDHFLREYWQRKPLYVKQAIDPGLLPIAPEQLFALAADGGVESRLVQQVRGRWALDHGPFARLPKSRRDWTVLVQGVNLHDARADALMDRFRWLPHARLDDVMISYAVPGGGVGPHFDSYDVFLLQARGTRRWRISTQKDLSLVPDFPLKILANFAPQAEYVCEPGDLLYLPPQCAHDGVALDECMTWSVGFRTPPYAELLREYLMFVADDIDIPGRYDDPGLERPRHPAQVPDRMVDTLERLVHRLRHRRADLGEFIGCFLSEPKATTVFDAAARPMTELRFSRACEKRGLVLHPRTQMLHDARRVYVNGESMVATADEGRILRRLADRRALNGTEYAGAPENVRHLFYDWYCDGWVNVT